jgi:hypothetical protein
MSYYNPDNSDNQIKIYDSLFLGNNIENGAVFEKDELLTLVEKFEKKAINVAKIVAASV